jgi:hypothetical protein
MLIKAVCKTHPEATVYLLEATTAYKNKNKNNKYVDEETERASYVQLDEANLYCTANEDLYNHDMQFEIVKSSTTCGHEENMRHGIGRCNETLCENYYARV